MGYSRVTKRSDHLEAHTSVCSRYQDYDVLVHCLQLWLVRTLVVVDAMSEDSVFMRSERGESAYWSSLLIASPGLKAAG